MELLLYESSKALTKIQAKLNRRIRNLDPENKYRNYEKLNAKHARFKRLEELRGKEWAE